MSSRPLRRRAALACVAAACLLPACRENADARRRQAEARVLTRQVENLREIKAALGQKRLVEDDWLAVAVDEAAVRSVIEAGLPQETTVAGRFHVLVHRAEVSFTSGASLVRLGARVTDTSSPGRFADVVYDGGLDDIVVTGGRLSTRVLVDNIEVPQVQTGGAPASLLTSAARELAGQNMERLQALIPPVALPVKVEQNIAIDGFGDGPVEVDPATLPVSAKVARVMPLSGRLWVFLDVEIGPWLKAVSPPAAPRAASKP